MILKSNSKLEDKKIIYEECIQDLLNEARDIMADNKIINILEKMLIFDPKKRFNFTQINKEFAHAFHQYEKTFKEKEKWICFCKRLWKKFAKFEIKCKIFWIMVFLF